MTANIIYFLKISSVQVVKLKILISLNEKHDSFQVRLIILFICLTHKAELSDMRTNYYKMHLISSFFFIFLFKESYLQQGCEPLYFHEKFCTENITQIEIEDDSFDRSVIPLHLSFLRMRYHTHIDKDLKTNKTLHMLITKIYLRRLHESLSLEDNIDNYWI